MNLIKCKFRFAYEVLYYFAIISLATIGVCVFGAFTSVGALFYLIGGCNKMGLPSVEQKDLDVMEKLLNEIDFSTKYTIFFQDVMHHEKEMIEKNEQYVEEYLKSFKLFRPLGFIITSIFIVIAVVIFKVEYNINIEINNLFNTSLYESITNTILSLFGNSYLPISGVSDLLRNFLKLDLVYILIFVVYDTYLIIRFLMDLFKYVKEKRKFTAFLNDKREIITKKFASEILPELRKATEHRKSVLEKFFSKYNLDKRLRNRENIAYLQELSEINKSKNITLKELEKTIIGRNLIKETFDTELWCKALLVYDINFPYYKLTNPFTRDLKKQRKEIVTILMLIFWPFTIYYYCFKIIFFYLKIFFKPGKNSSVTQDNDKMAKAMNCQSNLGVIDNDEVKCENMDKFLFRDTRGNLCESGGLFYDGKGNLCESGNWFYDFKGNLCSTDSAFYDSRGILRFPGEPFYDGKGHLIFPKN